jgi:hypothetical protein
MASFFSRYRRLTAVSLIPPVKRGLPTVVPTIFGSSYKRLENMVFCPNSNYLLVKIRTNPEENSFRVYFTNKIFCSAIYTKKFIS